VLRMIGEASFGEEITQPLLRYLQRSVGDRATAEDLLQETLLRATRGLEAFQERASLKTWIYSIATRVAADYLRHPDRRVRIVDIVDADEPASREESADERLIVNEMNACVRDVIDSLPADYRSALAMHTLEEMTAAEVAENSGCTVATAKIRIHRGRNRLRDALQRSCDFYRDREDSLRCDRKHDPPARPKETNLR
jgi:RNA polymerase sigma-70 factor, ECF subfamily